jgi:hypothetical protein
MTVYTYSLLTRFPTGYNQDILQLDIRNSTVIIAFLVSVDSPYTDVLITFSTPLSPTEKEALDLIVANHNPSSRIITSDLTIFSYNLTVGTNGGSVTKNTWLTRPLNTIEHGSERVTLNLGTSRFHLAPGRYQVYGSAEVGDIGDHRTRIQNMTTNTTAILGINCTTAVRADFSGIITSTEFAHEWALQHIASENSTTEGLGRAIALGGPEIFTIVHIQPL